MLRSTREITGYALQATDGEIGTCKDFLFDEKHWVIRYMVADTGGWILEKNVIISPLALGKPDWGSGRLPVHLTKERIENAPPLAEFEPISRQYEAALSAHYGHPYYWVGNALWGPGATPEQLRKHAEGSTPDPAPLLEGDPNLRSVNEVTGYHISATDGELGHIEEFIVEDDTWALRYLVVDTRNWLPGKKVLIPPSWIEDLDWSRETASVRVTREQIKNSPDYDPRTPVNRSYETRLYDFYGRPVYW